MNQIQHMLQHSPEELQRRLGCIVKHERDPRNKDFMLAARRPRRMPKLLHKYYNDPIFLNQGNTSACVGHAWAHWRLDGTIKPAKGESVLPFELYDMARDRDEFEGNDYEGSSTLGGVKAARDKGWVKEFYWGSTMEDIFFWLLEGKGPVVVGTPWDWNMFTTDKKGLITIGGGEAGGHEYEFNGINMDLELLRVKNSWGQQDWGVKGRGWMRFKDAGELIFNRGGDCCFATENKLKIAS